MSQDRSHPLVVERLRRNLSQQMLADFTGLGRATVMRAESGKPISAQSRQQLCDYLSKSAGELELIAEEDSPSVDDADDHALPRRRLLKGMGAASVALAGATSIGAQWLTRAHKALPSFETAAMDGLEQISNSFWQLRASMRSIDLLQGTIGQIDMVTRMAQTARNGPAQARLYGIAGVLALLAGQLTFDITELSAARNFYRLSADAATEARDTRLRAVAHARHSLTLFEEGHADQAVVLLERAAEEAKHGDGRTIGGWISAIQAESYATLGQRRETERALDIAEAYLEEGDDLPDTYWIGFNRSRLFGYRASCAVRLGQPEKALKAIQVSFAGIGVGDDRRRNRLLVRLAHAHAHMGLIEEACQVAMNALEGSIMTDNRMVIERLRSFHTTLEPWHSQPSVRTFTEQLLLA